MAQQGQNKTLYEQIKVLTIQLHDIGKISTDWYRCAEVACEQIVGNKRIAEICSIFGMTKREYIEYYLKSFRNGIN